MKSQYLRERGLRVLYGAPLVHDGFPAYELYVNGQTIYTYSPGPGPYGFGDILKLFPPLDVSVNSSGDLQ